jgi:hypothetical protein
MTDLIHDIHSPAEISGAAARLRQRIVDSEISPHEVMTVFDAWAASLESREMNDIPGILFLRMWLKRGNLEPIIARELGANALHGQWTEYGRAECKAYPVGVVGHWPAGNVEIQPLLSMTCALLGGNAALVRVPEGLTDMTRRLLEKLEQSDPGQLLTSRIFMAAFDHDRQDLHEAMAQSVDGAMIWGGKESVSKVRALPFPHWARLAVFGPRISAAAMDAGAWNNPDAQESWCRRIARDVWQFDQQACSSPQVLFLENETGQATAQFQSALRRAFEAENLAHPRLTIASALTSAICQARAAWLLQDTAHQAVFPAGPDWTLLFGAGSDLPQPTQGKTLTVLEVGSLFEAVAKFDGVMQTLGLGMADAEKESKLAGLAARKGVDRIVKLGRMHAFVPPWDGVDLIRPMVRVVRHVSSAD